MIGKRELSKTINRAMLSRETNDSEALERLGYDPAGVEELGLDLADIMLGRRVDSRDAIAAAFAAGLEVAVRIERERRGA